MRGNAHEARSLMRPDFSLIRLFHRTLRMFPRGSLVVFDEYVLIISQRLKPSIFCAGSNSGSVCCRSVC